MIDFKFSSAKCHKNVGMLALVVFSHEQHEMSWSVKYGHLHSLSNLHPNARSGCLRTRELTVAKACDELDKQA